MTRFATAIIVLSDGSRLTTQVPFRQGPDRKLQGPTFVHMPTQRGMERCSLKQVYQINGSEMWEFVADPKS